MKLNLIERDIQDRERALKSCEFNILYLKQENERKNRDVIHMLGSEAYLLTRSISSF